MHRVPEDAITPREPRRSTTVAYWRLASMSSMGPRPRRPTGGRRKAHAVAGRGVAHAVRATTISSARTPSKTKCFSPVKDPAVAVGHGRGGHIGPLPRSGRLGHGHRPTTVCLRPPPEEPLALLVGSRRPQAGRLAGGGRKAPATRTAELLEPPRPAPRSRAPMPPFDSGTVRAANRARPCGATVRRIPLPSSTTARTSDGGHSRSRTARNGCLQLPLVVGQLQIHSDSSSVLHRHFNDTATPTTRPSYDTRRFYDARRHHERVHGHRPRWRTTTG